MSREFPVKSGGAAAKPTIYVVDDDPNNLKNVRELLEEENYRVKTYSNPDTALRAIMSNCPKMVLADLNMPQMSGLELLVNVNRGDRSIPFTIMSTTDDVQTVIDVHNFREADHRFDICGFIRKPYDAEDFKLRVATAFKVARYNQLEIEKRDALRTSAVNNILQIDLAKMGMIHRSIDEESLRTEAHKILEMFVQPENDNSLPSEERFDEEVTEQGAQVFKVNGRDYILKPLPRKKAIQVYEDSDFFRKEKRRKVMPVEVVHSPIYREGVSNAWVLKEYIPGINLADFLLLLKAREDDPIAREFRNGFATLATNRIFEWQKRVQISDSNKIDSQEKCTAVIDSYHNNLISGLEQLLGLSDIDLSDEAMTFYEECLPALGFDRYVKPNIVKRKLDASFRNMMFSTDIPPEKIEDSIDELFDEVSGKRLSLKKLGRKVIHVDTGSKFGVALEDYVEVIDSAELDMPENERNNRIQGVLRDKFSAASQRKLLRKLEYSMRFYRAVRKAYFFGVKFGTKVHGKYKRKELGKRSYDEKIRRFTDDTRYYIGIAMRNLSRLIDEKRSYLDKLCHKSSSDVCKHYHSEGLQSLLDNSVDAEDDLSRFMELNDELEKQRRGFYASNFGPQSEAIKSLGILQDYLHLNYLLVVWQKVSEFTKMDYRKTEK